MSQFENDYKDILNKVLINGSLSENRTGVDTIKMFNQNMNIDLRRGFPIVTGKYIDFDKGYHEWKWIMDGGTTTKYLNEHNIHWWNAFANDRGQLGRIYGYQLRSFDGSFDQLEYVYKEIRSGSRRAVISLWNPTDLQEQALPCCYTNIIFMRDGENLNMHITFRSSDLFLGLPYDIVFGALMLHEVANFCDLRPAMLGMTLVDAHIYKNHVEPVKQYLSEKTFILPTYIKSSKTLFDYKHGPFIKAELNV